MNILIAAATEMEVSSIRNIWLRKHTVEFMVTGVGMIETTYSLTREFMSRNYDFAINIGLAGSFDRSLQIGEVVRVTEDILSEIGAESGDEFLSLKAIGLEGTDTFVNLDETLIRDIIPFRKVRAVTVNTVHGNEASIQKLQERLHPQIETMEGAAFFYVCGKSGISALQLRAISNYVEKRNKEAWNIPLALENIKNALVDLIEKL